MYALHQLDHDLWKITLPRPDVRFLPAAMPLNVYLFTGQTPALVNAGHPSQDRALAAALREVGVSPSRIERIAATSWSIDVMGGALSFPNASLFIASPDMLQPADHDSWQQERRQAWQAMLERVYEHPHFQAQRGHHGGFFEAAFPPLTTDLPFVPLRAGHQLAMGDDTTLEVIATPGPDEGHLCFFDAKKSRLFSGALTHDGMPERLSSVRDYIASLERAVEVSATTLLPNHGEPRQNASFALQRGARFLNNFLSNASNALKQAPTLFEFVEADMGYLPSDPVRFAATLLTYQAMLDEMVRARLILARGQGLERRYGVEPDALAASGES